MRTSLNRIFPNGGTSVRLSNEQLLVKRHNRYVLLLIWTHAYIFWLFIYYYYTRTYSDYLFERTHLFWLLICTHALILITYLHTRTYSDYLFERTHLFWLFIYYYFYSRTAAPICPSRAPPMGRRRPRPLPTSLWATRRCVPLCYLCHLGWRPEHLTAAPQARHRMSVFLRVFVCLLCCVFVCVWMLCICEPYEGSYACVWYCVSICASLI